MMALHEHNIVHRDLRPLHIMMNKGIPKIGGYNYAEIL